VPEPPWVVKPRFGGSSIDVEAGIEDGATVEALASRGVGRAGVLVQPYLQGFETIMWLYLNSQFAMAPGGDILTGPGVIDGGNVDAIIQLTAAGYR